MPLSALTVTHLVAAIFQLGLAIYAFGLRDRHAVKPFIALCISQAMLLGVIVLDQSTSGGEGSRGLFSLALLAGSVSSVAQWLFAISYVKLRIPRGLVLAVMAMPVLFAVMLATDGYHHLVWQNVPSMETGRTAVVGLAPGPYFLVHMLIGTGLIVWSMGLFARTAWTSQGVFRYRALLLLAGPVCTVFTSTLVFVGSEVPTEIGVVVLAVGNILPGLAFVWGLARLQLFDLVGVARATLVDAVADAMIVVDEQGRIIDINAAGNQLFDTSLDQALGKPLGAVSSKLTDTDLLASGDFAVERGSEVRLYETRRFPLQGQQGPASGQLLLVRDVTELRELEAVRNENIRVEGVLLAVRTVEHELNNKLALISGYTELLTQARSDQPADPETLGYVLEASQHAAEAIRKLGTLTEVREKHWGPGLRSTLDLDQPNSYAA